MSDETQVVFNHRKYFKRWATLLTPQVVQRDTRISGFELDFSIPAVHDLMVERADVSPG